MFKDLYAGSIVTQMIQKFGYRSIMQVPRLKMIALNVGLASVAASDPKFIDAVVSDVTVIAGQKAVVTKARKSIAGFKLREGNPVGCRVTLRGERMYNFFEKLVYMALPLERDFRGVGRSQFDGRGNCSFGIKEHIIFHEIEYDKVYKIFGLDVNIVTTAVSDDEARYMLSLFGLPFHD